MESKPVSLRVGTKRHRIRPVERKLCLGAWSYSIRQVLNRRGGLIIGEGDTGKSTYVQMLHDAAKTYGTREPILVKLRTRPTLSIPDVPPGETQTIIWDGLDEFPECARDIVDLTSDLDPERYHIWVTSRPGSAASHVAASPLLEDVYHLSPFTDDDVIRTAESVQLDGEAFLIAVRGTHLEAFMRKPGGAVILMQLFADGHLDRPSRTELMETIMLDFARETRDGDDECNPKLPFAQRDIVEATCWMAACLVLTGKDAIWTGAKSACPKNDIFIEDLPSRDFNPAIFKAALGLRLFEPLTQQRYRLAYSEMPPFLAGRWLAKNLADDEIQSLIPREPDFFTDAHARVIAWVSCYKPSVGAPWIAIRPDRMLACHELITQVGCRKVFDYLIGLYRRKKYAGPTDFVRNISADLIEFKPFIAMLVATVTNKKSAEDEIAIALVLLQGCAHANEDVVDALVDVAVSSCDRLSELNLYRAFRTLSHVCRRARFDSLADLAPYCTYSAKGTLTADIRRFATELLNPPTLHHAAKLGQPKTERPRDSSILTEREVAKTLQEIDLGDLDISEDDVKKKEETPLSQEDEDFIAEIYPDLDPDDEPTQDDYDQLEENRKALREELSYEHVYDDDASVIDPYTEIDLANEQDELILQDDQSEADKYAEQFRNTGTALDRIMAAQEDRGLNYCALSSLLRDTYHEGDGYTIFTTPKLFACALQQEPDTYIPVLITALENCTTQLTMLAGLERSPAAHFLTDALARMDIADVIRLYRLVLCGGKLFRGYFLESLAARICKEPTDETLATLYAMLTTTRDKSEDRIDYIAQIIKSNNSALEAHERLVRAVSTANRRRTGNLKITLKGLAMTGLPEEPELATREDVESIVSHGTEEIKAGNAKTRDDIADLKSTVTQTAIALPGQIAEKIKNRGGRPKKSRRDGNYLSQDDVAKMFGPPCNTAMVSNWERFVRTGGKVGAQPPSANIYSRWVSYSSELRENYTGDNCIILAEIIEAFKSCHAVKTRIGKDKIVHNRTDESLYLMQHPDGKVRTENRGDG